MIEKDQIPELGNDIKDFQMYCLELVEWFLIFIGIFSDIVLLLFIQIKDYFEMKLSFYELINEPFAW